MSVAGRSIDRIKSTQKRKEIRKKVSETGKKNRGKSDEQVIQPVCIVEETLQENCKKIVVKRNNGDLPDYLL